jgi:hypothetical protein
MYDDNFNRANEKIHPAESGCWGHVALVSKGFNTDTPPQKGLVRRYNYQHPDGTKIAVSIGVNADYWDGTLSDGSTIEQWYREPRPDAYDALANGLFKFLETNYHD